MSEKELNDAKKEYLNRYKKAYLKWLSLCEQENSIRLEIESVGSPGITDMPKDAKNKTCLII